MYQTYNVKNDCYGVIYKSQNNACAMAKQFSAIFRNEQLVIDTDTGEILYRFVEGLEMEV